MAIDNLLSTQALRFSAKERLPFFAALLWIVLFFPTFQDLFQRWVQWDSELAHGLPVMATFLYLVWAACPWQPKFGLLDKGGSSVALALTVVLSLTWFLAYAVNIQILEQLLLIPILASALAVIYGWRKVYQHRFLLLFPIFAIPLWGSFNGILLSMASTVVGELVRLIEMPAMIRGNSIFIPHGHIVIADGCSGLRYFVIALTLAYLIGYLNNYREKQMFVLLAIATLLGLVTNWIRIFLLIIIGYNTQMESGLMQDHELFGWLLFALICLPAIYFAPVVKRANGSKERLGELTMKPRFFMLFAALLIGPVLAVFAQMTLSNTPAKELIQKPLGHATMPVAVNAPEGGVTTIEKASSGVFVRVDQYQRESLEDKLVPYLSRFYDNQVWLRVRDDKTSLGSEQVATSVFSEKGSRRHVAQIQWFVVGPYVTHSVVKAKLLQIPAVVSASNQFEIATLQAECVAQSCSQAFTLLEAKAQALLEREPGQWLEVKPMFPE